VRGVFNIKKEHAEAVVNLMNKHQIRPQVGEVFEWEDAKEAFRKSMDWNVVGKIVIKV
jgi:D-arabinose 1-dehydrogenase-like Zn-dependent alcohol dehydrogenase